MDECSRKCVMLASSKKYAMAATDVLRQLVNHVTLDKVN